MILFNVKMWFLPVHLLKKFALVIWILSLIPAPMKYYIHVYNVLIAVSPLSQCTPKGGIISFKELMAYNQLHYTFPILAANASKI